MVFRGELMVKKKKSKWIVGRLGGHDCLFFRYGKKKVRIAILQFIEEQQIALINPCQRTRTSIFRNRWNNWQKQME